MDHIKSMGFLLICGIENLLSFFVFVFEFIRENAEICKILLGQDGDYTFLNKFKGNFHLLDRFNLKWL